MKKLLLIITLIFGFNLWAELIDYNISATSKKAQVTLSFDQNVEEKDIHVDFINSTIQFDILGQNSSIDKKSIKLKNKNVKSVYFYNPEKNLSRVRLILKKPFKAEKFKNGVSYEAQGKQVILYLDTDPILPSKERQAFFKGHEDVVQVKKKKPAIDLAESEFFKTDFNKKLKKNNSEESFKELPESEIPVFTAQTNEVKKEKQSSLSQLLLSLILICAVAGGVFFFARWWGNRVQVNEIDTQMRVMSQFHLGPKKNLSIVRVAGEFLLLGVTDHSINLIKPLSIIDDEFNVDGIQSFEDKLSLNEGEFENLIQKTKDEITLTKGSKKSEGKGSLVDDKFLLDLKSKVSEKLKGMKKIV